VGTPDANGKRVTNESSVTATTAPAQILPVGAMASSATTAIPWVRLSWPYTSDFTGVKLITSSYGLRLGGLRLWLEGSPVFLNNVPRGTHSFAVTPFYLNGVPAPTTTVTVVVP